MNRPTLRTGRLALLASALLLLGATGQAQAQLMVDLKLNKKDYVAYEPVKAVVTVRNRTGRDIVLGGRGATGWLTFSVSAGSRMVIPMGAHPHARPSVLKSGQTVSHSVSLGKYFAIGKPRNYSIKAGAYYNDEVFYSRPSRITVSEGHVIWQQVAGVPSGESGAGSRRRFQVLTFRTKERNEIYIRVKDEKSGHVRATYSLGRIIRVRDPQATVDGKNRLHVLFHQAPKTYSHVVIATSGHTLDRGYYREIGRSVPRLMLSNDGVVTVEGGNSYDPVAVAAAEAAGIGSVRKLSDRPADLPLE